MELYEAVASISKQSTADLRGHLLLLPTQAFGRVRLLLLQRQVAVVVLHLYVLNALNHFTASKGIELCLPQAIELHVGLWWSYCAEQLGC